MRAGAVALLVLALLQIYLGALVAGLRAGLIYNTWPLIDGRLVPEASRLFHDTPAWRNLFENTLTVQFNHRMTAYLLLAARARCISVDVARTAPRALPLAAALAGAIVLQAALGILTLLHQVPIALALAHQAGAIAGARARDGCGAADLGEAQVLCRSAFRRRRGDLPFTTFSRGAALRLRIVAAEEPLVG